MSLEGMDVDQAQQLARQLDGYARALTHLTTALGTLAGELGYHWQGPASATFQQQWAARYRGALGGGRLVVMSNRAPIRVIGEGPEEKIGPTVGGVGTTFLRLLERQGGVWIGWAG